MLSFLKGKVSGGLARRPVEMALDTCEDIREEYNRVAAKLGRPGVPVAQDDLRKVLRDLSISAYDQGAVERYLDKKGYWAWYRFRESHNPWRSVNRQTHTGYPSLYGETRSEVYVGAIPLPVLLTVEQILDKCPAAEFLVAAIKQHPDPFLGVRGLNGLSELFIIERWDEPSFRG